MFNLFYFIIYIMNSDWLTWSLLVLALASTMNINTTLPSKKIKEDPLLLSIWMRCAIIIAGILAFISFFIPKIGLTEKYIKLAKQEFNAPLTVWTVLTLLVLFSVVPIAIKNAGAVAVAIMNLDFAVQVIFDFIVHHKIPGTLELIGTVAVTAATVFLAYGKSLSK